MLSVKFCQYSVIKVHFAKQKKCIIKQKTKNIIKKQYMCQQFIKTLTNTHNLFIIFL